MSDPKLLSLSSATEEMKSGCQFTSLLQARRLLGFMRQNSVVFCRDLSLKTFSG